MTQNNHQPNSFNRLGNNAAPATRGPLATLLAIISGTALIALGFTFSLVILAVVTVIGLFGFGYIWWKTRALRKQIREQMENLGQQRPAAATVDVVTGDIIEGEVIREERETTR
jgi:Flp pilus assembly protein TadB